LKHAFFHVDACGFAGKVVEVAALSDVQDKVYDEPTILLANRVSGEEEIPEGVVAVVTPDAPDILSHSSVRARNMKVCSALCYSLQSLEPTVALLNTDELMVDS
jgi:alpha-glucan,water dikinase